MIETSGERRSAKSMLASRHDDDIYVSKIHTVMYIFIRTQYDLVFIMQSAVLVRFRICQLYSLQRYNILPPLTNKKDVLCIRLKCIW